MVAMDCESRRMEAQSDSAKRRQLSAPDFRGVSQSVAAADAPLVQNYLCLWPRLLADLNSCWLAHRR